MLRAIIIDDEQHCIDTLVWQINTYCRDIQLLESFSEPQEGLKYIENNSIDILFLDVDMPKMNGFQLLEKVQRITFDVIFTTAHDKFAVKAIKISALDYLIKPVDEDELTAAIDKAKSKQTRNAVPSIEHLLGQIQKNALSDRIYLPTLSGLEFIDTARISRCESDSNYTTVFMDQSKITVSKTLKEIEEMLPDKHFFRVHNSHLVNLKKVAKYVKGDGGHLVMRSGEIIPVSRARKQTLLDYLK